MESLTNKTEQTFILLKPDSQQRGYVGRIISLFEEKGLKLIALKMVSPGKELLETHYQEHKGRGFFNDLIEYMQMAPVIAMVWQGSGVVSCSRKLLGTTEPKEATIGSIRGDFCLEKGRLVIHGSDSVEAAEREINLWFDKSELVAYSKCDESNIFEH